ncbi:efflux RND transporter permease subunit [Oceanobacter mangrovi]|uniref:efflux RND transporter permease subunit n=1 Tax=Oceanobacter mangrovi TaxID=2862510 RepID=UPI001C8D4403|nr:efflux RND transporter permease subunit [Oceanobacter mangrovi]
MQIPRLAIRYYQFTLVIIALLVLLGTVSYLTMPRSEDPQFNFPAALIKAVSPGTTPEDIETLVVDPLESELYELEDVAKLETRISDGLAVIQIEFLYGTDADDKFDEVVAAVSRARSELPDTLALLDVDRISPAEVSILQIALTSADSDYELLTYHANQLERRLERVSGVKRVDVDALPEMEMQIELDALRLEGQQLPLAQVIGAIKEASGNIPAGHLLSGDRRFTVRTSGEFDQPEDVEQVVVKAASAGTQHLGDLAEVRFTTGLPIYRAELNGQTAVFLSVVQRRGTQIFNVMDGVKAAMEDYRSQLPDTLAMTVVMDQSESVDRQISGFFNNFYQGLALVAIAALLVLGWRSSLVVVMAIPLSILIAIGWLDLSGFGLQQMSIVGLVIALGLLVDNAIVVVENIKQQRHKGLSGKVAAIEGSQRVAWAVASGTITTVLSFLPMLMMQNSSGTFIRAMPVTVILALVASLLIALTVTPLTNTLFKAADEEPDSKAASKPPRGDTTLLHRWLEQVAAGAYATSLATVVKRPILTLLVSIAMLVGSVALIPVIGVSLFPKAEKPMILVNLDLPESASFEQTRQLAREVENILRQYELVKDVAINIGRGNPRIYYNEIPAQQRVNYGQLFVTLKAFELPVVEPFVAQLRERFEEIAGADITVKELLQGPPIAAPVEIRIVGNDIRTIQSVSKDIADLLKSTEGLTDIDNPVGRHKTDIRVDIDREKAAMLGIGISTIDQMVRATLAGVEVGSYRHVDGEIYPLMVRLNSNEARAQGPMPQLSLLESLRLMSADGQLIPLSQVADIRFETGIARFQHRDTERTAQVTAQVLPGFITQKVTERVVESLDAYHWPAGVRYVLGGEAASRDEAFGGMAKALILAVLGIYAVLVLQFRSFVQPMIIFGAIPFAVIGAVWALYFTGYTFSFTAFVGLTSLIGIVVNNAIILVDTANQNQLEGESRVDAILESARTRFIPIVLTSVTTIGGLLPLTLSGSSMWSPMGWAIVGGLLFSTLLTLYVVPALYRWMGEVPK